jgi:hypothetical protein
MSHERRSQCVLMLLSLFSLVEEDADVEAVPRMTD